jgi:hypothetical protein
MLVVSCFQTMFHQQPHGDPALSYLAPDFRQRARRVQFGPAEGKHVQDLSSTVDLLVWSPLENLCFYRFALSFYPKIQSSYRLLPGPAQEGFR